MKRDERFFEGLVNAHYAQVYATILSKIDDPLTAGDLTQNTFCRAWLKMEQLQQPEAARGWLRTIADNQVKMYYRALQTQKRSRFETLPLQEELADCFIEGVDDGLQYLLAKDIDRDLQVALAALDPCCRKVIWMRVVDEFSFAAIGRRLGITAAAATRQCRRGLKQLRSAYLQRAELHAEA